MKHENKPAEHDDIQLVAPQVRGVKGVQPPKCDWRAYRVRSWEVALLVDATLLSYDQMRNCVPRAFDGGHKMFDHTCIYLPLPGQY